MNSILGSLDAQEYSDLNFGNLVLESLIQENFIQEKTSKNGMQNTDYHKSKV
jgi:hypothetical protein